MKSFGVISNPNSGHNRDQFPRIRQLLDQLPGVRHEITGSVHDLPAALERLARNRVDALVINGGDGTGSALIGHAIEHDIFEKLPPVIILPGGTANMNAGDVGVRGKLEKATGRLLAWAQNGGDTRDRLVQRPLLRVATASGPAAVYGMFLGAGAVMQATEYAHRELHSRGLRDDFSLALTTVRTVWGVYRDDPRFNQHVTVSMTLEDESSPRRHDTLILAISSLQRLFMGMRPFWGTGPGALRLTLIEQHATRFPTTFLSLARGRPNANAVPDSGYFSHNASRIRLQMEGSINLDGEIIDTGGEICITASEPVNFLRL
jgi:diacylglycerol kinase family enzyme